MSKDLIQTLIDELFHDYTECGKNNAYKAFHPWVDYSYSSAFGDTAPPHIIPDRFYHPKVKVAIDFRHQFVLNTKEDKLQGKRPVLPNTLRNTAIQLANFFSYYFDYILSYGKNLGTNPQLRNFLERIQSGTDEAEFEMSYFINTILNFFLTSVSIERSRDGIGSATITLRDNPNYRNNKKINIFLNKTVDILNQIFVPMLPIMVWARGRLYKDWWFPIFDGYTLAPQTGNAQGFTSVTLMCKDALELARISAEMVNPAIIQLEEFRKQTAINIFTKPLYGLDHFTIFDLMFHGGNVIYVSERDEEGNAVGGGKLLGPDDPRIRSGFTDVDENEYLNFSALGRFGRAREDTKYKPEDISDAKSIRVENNGDLSMWKLLQETSHDTRPRYTSVWGSKITPYRIFNFQTPDIFSSEFASRLDVIKDVAGMCYYEIYIDGYGNVQYHPMRLHNDFLYYDIIYSTDDEEKRHRYTFPGSQIVGPEEIINVSSLLNIEALTTFLRLHGLDPVIGERAPSELVEVIGSATDKKYMQRYGYRRQEIKNPLFNYNPDLVNMNGEPVKFMNLAAQSLLRFMNAELYTRTATMIFRPELELASPLFFTDDKSVFYVQSISHSITIGGDATTTVNCNFGRKDIQLPPDLQSYILATEKLYNIQDSVYATWDEQTFTIHKAETESWRAPVVEWEGNYADEQEFMDEYISKSDKEKRAVDKEQKRREKERQAAADASKDSRDKAERKRAKTFLGYTDDDVWE